MVPLTEATRITPLPTGTWEGHIPPEWSQGRTAFGGLSAGLALNAILHMPENPGQRPLKSVLVDFVGPLAPGKVSIEAKLLRSGKNLAHTEARIYQDDTLCLILIAIFGQDRPSRIHWASPPSPPAPAPENVMVLPYIEGVTPTFTQNFSYRWSTGGLPFSSAPQPILGGYVRLKGKENIQNVGVLAILDAWPAPVLPMLSQPAAASTVTWMVDFLQAPPPTGWPADQWWRFEADTLAADAGGANISGHLWGPEGLVAVSHQWIVEFSGR